MNEIDRFPGSFFGPPTLVELLRHRAAYQAWECAYRFLVDGDSEEISVTYHELDRQARAIAAKLQEQGLAGERAVLLYPPGLDFIAAFFGCLYAGAIAVPAYPPRMNRSLYRIQVIAADAESKIALTTRGVLDRVQPMARETDFLREMKWLATDEVEQGAESAWHDPRVRSSTLAFLQYTSGSTGTPKGVMLSHANLLHNSALISHAFEHTRSGAGVFWLPSYHDMGLIGGILQPLYVARPNVLMSPMAFLQRPVRWLRAITNYNGTTSGGPNFAYDLCVDKITDEQLAELDLSSWLVAFNGAEPVRPETLDRFCERFGPVGFRREAFFPCFGLAEGTLIVTGGMRTEEPVVVAADARSLETGAVEIVTEGTPGSRRLVGSGENLPDQEVLIVDPHENIKLPAGRVGEIWARGPSIAGGYWNRPDETQYTFGAKLATGEGPFLRTGDLGFMKDGELFVTGRLKDLIIVHGLNHYPQDLELSAQRSHPALRSGSGAAFTIETDSQKLVLVHEMERKEKDDVLRVAAEAVTAIRREIARHHELVVDGVALIRSGSIPKTSSGKIQRHACCRAYLDDTLSVIAQWPGDVELVDVGVQPAGGSSCGDDSEDETVVEELPAPATTSTLAAKQPPRSDKPPVTAAARDSADRGASTPAARPAPAPVQDAATIVLEEVRRIARQRAHNATLDTTFAELGMDSLERIELQAALEDRFGGRMPEDVGPDLETMGQVVEAVKQHLGTAAAVRRRVPVADIPAEHYRFEQYPEYLQLRQNLEMLDAAGLTNPFFSVHQSVTRDTTEIGGRVLINFSSFNYLGMSGEPVVSAAAKAAVDRFGTSVSASRLVSGEKTLHRELEQALAQWLGGEDCIVFVAGHGTNETVIGHLFGPGDLILHDALAHNSIVQGGILSGARRRAFPHNDHEALDRLLHDLRGEFRRVLIAIEGIYSMDGDIPDLPKFVEVKKRHKAFLMIDEAHSIGVLGDHGRGIGEHFDVDPSDVDLWMGTISKSLGSCGGYVVGSKAVVQFLKYTAPGFVYATGMSPPNAAAALASLHLLADEPQRVQALRDRSALFLRLAKERGLNTGKSHDSPVIPVILGSSVKALQLSRALNMRDINAQPILYPAVEESAARVRFFITALHTEDQIRYTVDCVAEELAKIEAAWAETPTA
ncbi:MAG: aminotransferase class I/II-fold pyridoxal phosphate-dependent enzyme [Planctomycetia bacterium]|nr:aminotransferase class I/II-fold pyridoxal phosphate-dependent enzyme [Planctomycetia bacterium]